MERAPGQAPGSSCDGPGDGDDDYDFSYVTGKMFSLQWRSFSYCHGTPHGFGGETSQNVVLPAFRPLGAQDVFGDGDGWRARLQRSYLEKAGREGWRPPGNQAEQVRERIAGDVVEPGRWVFSGQGLAIAFSSYDGGCYACRTPDTVLSWAELRPLLAPASPVP